MEIFTKIAIAFENGGIWMWPIAAFQIGTVAIIVERVIALYVKRKTEDLAYVEQFEDKIRRGELESVIQKTQESSHRAIGLAVRAGARAAAGFGGKEEIQGKMDEILLLENTRLSQRVGFLSMLGNVATLTGLLGTITGMIKSFAAVAYANPAEKASLLAQGISEAMNATAFGLIVAIPALIAYAILQNRANNLSDDLNQAALKVYHWLSYAYEAIPMKYEPTKNDSEKGSGKRSEIRV